MFLEGKIIHMQMQNSRFVQIILQYVIHVVTNHVFKTSIIAELLWFELVLNLRFKQALPRQLVFKRLE